MRTAVAGVGSRVLAEIEETTLDEVLASLRASFVAATDAASHGNDSNAIAAGTRLKVFPFAPLNQLVNLNFRATESAPLAITGRYRELLYVLVATLIAAPHEKAVVIVDCEGRFDPLRLLATRPYQEATTEGPAGAAAIEPRPGVAVQGADLDHVHVLRPGRRTASDVADCVASIEGYMLYGSHRSRGREWWGTVVIGGGLSPARTPSAAVSAQIAVTADWKGWLRVDRAEVATFSDRSAQEALVDREARQAAVEAAGWTANSPWGSFTICAME